MSLTILWIDDNGTLARRLDWQGQRHREYVTQGKARASFSRLHWRSANKKQRCQGLNAGRGLHGQEQEQAREQEQEQEQQQVRAPPHESEAKPLRRTPRPSARTPECEATPGQGQEPFEEPSTQPFRMQTSRWGGGEETQEHRITAPRPRGRLRAAAPRQHRAQPADPALQHCRSTV